MPDVRQELVAEWRHGKGTHVGDLCGRASELIRKLECENYEMRDRLAAIRSQSDVSKL